jgi:DNA-binding CsgD family transcriptional regulator
MRLDGGSTTPKLTTLERHCLRLLGEGRTKSEVARSLGLDWEAAAKHMQAAFNKLGTQNPHHAVALALKFGLIEPDESDQ